MSRGNRTLCEVVSVQLKPHAQVKWKNYYGKKVRTVLASHVQHLEVQKTKPASMVQAEKNDDIKGKLNDYLDPPSRICELKAQLETLQAQLKKQK